MHLVQFLVEVERPVLLEVAVAAQGSEFQDGFCAVESPACAGQVEPVFDQVSAGAFDDAGRDGPACLECLGVVEVVPFGEQVVGAAVGAASGVGLQAEGDGFAPDRGGDGAGLPVQDGEGFGGDPFLGGGVAFGVKRPGRRPQVQTETPQNPDIAPRRPPNPRPQQPDSIRAHHPGAPNTLLTAPTSNSQASLQGSRTRFVSMTAT